jgi:lambda family phage portal protein
MGLSSDFKFLSSNISSLWKNRPSLRNNQDRDRALAQRMFERGINYAFQKRDQYKNAYYPGAETARFRSDWLTKLVTSTSLLRSSFKTLVARSEYAFRTDPYAKRAIDILKTFVIGSGIRPFPAARNQETGEKLENINKQLANKWDRINDEVYRLGSQRVTALEAQGIEFETMAVSGAWLRQVIKGNGKGILPYAVNILKPTRLDFSHDTYFDENTIIKNQSTFTVLGQQMNMFYEPEGFWIDTENTMRIAANMSIHYRLVEAEQYLGIPWLTPALGHIWDIQQLFEDKLIQSRLLTRMGVWSKKESKKDFQGILENVGSDSSEESIPFDKSMIYFADEQPKPIQFDDKISESFSPMVKIVLHAIAIGVGFSYQLLSSDLENANFASGRLNRLIDAKVFRALYKQFYKCSCQELWNKIVEWLVLTNQIQGLSYSDYLRNPWQYSQCFWLPEGEIFDDPLTDAQANKLLLMTGQTTLQELCASKGKDYISVLTQRKIEKDLLKELGLEELLPSFADKPMQTVNSNNDVREGAEPIEE